MKTNKLKNIYVNIFIIIVWLVIWQVLASIINNSLVITTPLLTLKALYKLIVVGSFWVSVWGSVSHIMLGFGFAFITAILLSMLSYFFSFFKKFVTPPLTLFKSVPVASFTILLLISLSNKSNVSTIISFIMALPVMYAHLLAGLESIDKKNLEMARIFDVPAVKRFKYIYLHGLLPYVSTSSVLALGLSWKAGVAAELIALAQNTIGNELYYAKLYLLMDYVFAWTIVVVAISVLLEKLIVYLIMLLKSRLER